MLNEHRVGLERHVLVIEECSIHVCITMHMCDSERMNCSLCTHARV